MAFDDPAQVFVGYRHRMTKGIKQNGIGGFRPHPGQSQETLAEIWCRLRRQRFQRALKLRIQHRDEGLQRGRLARREAGGADQFLQLRERDAAQAFDRECVRFAQICERSLYRLPCRVLGQVCAQNHFEWRLSRPPRLRSVSVDKVVVHGPQAFRRSWVFWIAGLTSQFGPSLSRCLLDTL